MKKQFIFILMLISVIAHSFACEKDSAIGIIEDSFFKLKNTVVSIRSIIPHDDHYMAVVDASNEYDSKTTSIRPFFSKTWEHNDQGRFSQERLLVTVMCGDKVVEKPQLLDTKYPYLFLKDITEEAGVLSVGNNQTVYKMSEYERPDKSLFRLRGDALYELSKKEERVNAPMMSICNREWSILSKWEKKLRHSRNVYTTEEVYEIISKTSFESGKALTPEEISRVLVRKELRLHHVDPDVPECGSVGRQIPNATFIVG